MDRPAARARTGNAASPRNPPPPVRVCRELCGLISGPSNKKKFIGQLKRDAIKC